MISKKILLALEVASTKAPDQINVLQMKLSLADRWKDIEPESLDLFVRIFSIELSIKE